MTIAEGKSRINEELGLKLKAQVLHEIAKNSMKWSEHSTPENKAALLTKAEKYLADSISINEQFPDNHLVLASNIDLFGEIDLRKQNYPEAKNNFMKGK